MFECKTCTVLSEEVKYLREQNKSLSDKLLAVSHPHALAASRQAFDSGEYYGSSEDDRLLAFDEFGQETSIEAKKAD